MTLPYRVMLPFTLMLFLVLQLAAQENPVADMNESLVDEESFIVEQLDSLTGAFFENHKALKAAENETINPWVDSILQVSDSVMLEKMSMLTSEIPLSYNSRVRRYIEVYGIEKKDKTQEILGLVDIYFPVFEEYLERNNMPHMLKYLPVVESALNPNAVSRAGATGLWQIMYSTGRMLGLHVNSYVDERRDPYLATDAALNYLNKLYSLYGDWLLVIAAYNCGPGNVNKAISRSGGKRNFWQLMQYLPHETRGYVPAFMGAIFVLTHAKEFGIEAVKPKYSFPMVDTILINKQLALSAVAEELQMDIGQLEFLNPALKKKIVPVSEKGYALKLPVDKVGLFEARKDTIYSRLPDLKEEMTSRSEISSDWNTSSSTFSKGNLSRLVYRVKSGDNLGYIAEWYNCSAQQIRNWNGLYGSRINVGQKLNIYVHKDDYDQYYDIDRMSFSEKQARAKSPAPVVKYESSNARMDNDCGCIYYKVREGDTLWDISRKYRVSMEEIQKHNNLSNGRDLKPGMVLKIMI